jgi:hypothetical protein
MLAWCTGNAHDDWLAMDHRCSRCLHRAGRRGDLDDGGIMPERLTVNVTFDQQRGYVASSDVLGTITALSLSGLRRQIDARLGKDVIPRLVLDKRARLERDARRAGGARRASDISAR